MAKITISVEIVDAGFRKNFQLDPAEPLTELVRRISEEEGFPLRTKTGRPIAWTAEGPSWRPGKEGHTDLVRTQSLEKIAQRFLDEGGPKTPLFEVVLEIPGAAEAIRSKRQEQKLEDIDTTLDKRRQERLDEMGTAADFTMDTAEQMAYQEPPPPPLPAPPPPPAPKPVEKRIRRAKRPAPKKAAPDRRLLFAAGGAGCFLLLIVVAIMVVLAMPEEPEPAPPPLPVAAAPAPPVEVRVTPTPAPRKEKPTPPPMEVFWKKGNITRSSASGAGPDLTSYGKEQISLNYTVRQTGAGSHTVSLKGRFSVTITDTGGIIETSSGHPISKGAVIGKDTRVKISNLDGAVSVKIGGKRYGPYKLKKSGSFPAWKISISSGATLHNMKASARVK